MNRAVAIAQRHAVEALAVLHEVHLDELGPTDEDAVFASLVGTGMSRGNVDRDPLDAHPPRRRPASRS